MIRLSAIQTVDQGLRDWLNKKTILILVVARILYSSSAEPHRWIFLCLGWKLMQQSWEYFYDIEKTPSSPTPASVAAISSSSTGNTTTVITTISSSSSSTSEKKAAAKTSTTISSVLFEFPNTVITEICLFLYPSEVCALCCLNTKHRTFYSNSKQIWKQIWYRDYGNVLLQWPISRQVLSESLLSTTTTRNLFNDHHQQQSLEWKLSYALEHNYCNSSSSSSDNSSNKDIQSLKDFYFVFGEIYMDYLLHGRNCIDHNTTTDGNNNKSDCYLGLHGHIFDFGAFAKYHPGLSMGNIQMECGQDATRFFEDIPHSSTARLIAQRLVVLVHKGLLQNGNHDGSRNNSVVAGCGLYLPPQTSSSTRKKWLESSNTRPPPSSSNNDDGRENVSQQQQQQQQHKRIMSDLLPKKPSPPSTTSSSYSLSSLRGRGRRPRTLQRIRTEWDAKYNQQQQLTIQQKFWSHLNFENNSEYSWRYYYDPFKQEWQRWDAAANC